MPVQALIGTADLYVALIVVLFSLVWERDRMVFLLWLCVCALYATSGNGFRYLPAPGQGGVIDLATETAVIMGVFYWWVFYKPIAMVAGFFGLDFWLSKRGVV